MPQAFFKNVSVVWAGLTAWSSVTRFVTETEAALDGLAHPDSAQQRPSEMMALLNPRVRTHIIGWVPSL